MKNVRKPKRFYNSCRCRRRNFKKDAQTQQERIQEKMEIPHFLRNLMRLQPRFRRKSSRYQSNGFRTYQRGGAPCPYDRYSCIRLGAAAAQAIIDEDYGNMNRHEANKTVRVPLEKLRRQIKVVEKDSPDYQEAKFMGISFGD